ncbi:MAG: T9SS type A sorting domain-containing protein [Candidatus Margulisbacteria bacterium]|nr:T9SS type A sorting domain-containing protein [Candidatus Margulisiibacteriota bacterium]
MRRTSWLLVLLLAITVINYPNPFNPKGGQWATFECTSDTNTEAFLYIYDMSARLITRQTLSLTGGTTTKTAWNGYSDYNELVGNGIYFYQLLDSAKKRVSRGKIWVINN